MRASRQHASGGRSHRAPSRRPGRCCRLAGRSTCRGRGRRRRRRRPRRSSPAERRRGRGRGSDGASRPRRRGVAVDKHLRGADARAKRRRAGSRRGTAPPRDIAAPARRRARMWTQQAANRTRASATSSSASDADDAAVAAGAHRALGDVQPDAQAQSSDTCRGAGARGRASGSRSGSTLIASVPRPVGASHELPGEAEHDQRERRGDRQRPRPAHRGRSGRRRRPSLLMMPAMHRSHRPVTGRPRAGAGSPPSQAAGRGWRPCETLVRRFREDRLALTAGGLTFTTIISLVPLVTVMLALFSAFPMFATLQESLQRYFLQALVPDSIARPVMSAITQFSTRASRLGIVGLVALCRQRAGDDADRRSRAERDLARPQAAAASRQRVLVYWAAVTLGPLIFAVSLAATSYAVSVSRGLVGGMPRGLGDRRRDAEFVLERLGVAALFHYVPNTDVRWRHALIGGLFVAICMAAAKRALTALLRRGADLRAGLRRLRDAADLPRLDLPELGDHPARRGDRRLCAADRQDVCRAGPTRPAREFHLALVVLAQLDAARAMAGAACTADDIAAAIGIDPLQIDPVLEALVRARLGRPPRGARQRAPRAAVRPGDTLAEPLLASAAARPPPRRSGRRGSAPASRDVYLAELIASRCRAPDRRRVTTCRRSAARRSGRRGVPRGAIRRSRR